MVQGSGRESRLTLCRRIPKTSSQWTDRGQTAQESIGFALKLVASNLLERRSRARIDGTCISKTKILAYILETFEAEYLELVAKLPKTYASDGPCMTLSAEHRGASGFKPRHIFISIHVTLVCPSNIEVDARTYM
jgi:hypothetical protein